jgi:hypothetical protein
MVSAAKLWNVLTLVNLPSRDLSRDGVPRPKGGDTHPRPHIAGGRVWRGPTPQLVGARLPHAAGSAACALPPLHVGSAHAATLHHQTITHITARASTAVLRHTTVLLAHGCMHGRGGLAHICSQCWSPASALPSRRVQAPVDVRLLLVPRKACTQCLPVPGPSRSVKTLQKLVLGLLATVFPLYCRRHTYM